MNNTNITDYLTDTLHLEEDDFFSVVDRIADLMADEGCYCNGGIRSVTYDDGLFYAVKAAPCSVSGGEATVNDTSDLLFVFDDETMEKLGVSASSCEDEIDYSEVENDGDECTCTEKITFFVKDPGKFSAWVKAFLACEIF